MELKPGTVKALYNNQRNNPLYSSPVLQVIGLVKLPMGPNEKPRYKANVSDGQHYMKAVFSSELTSIFEEGTIKRFSLIRTALFTLRPKENNNYLYIQSVSEFEASSSVIGQPINIVTGKPSTEPSLGAEPAKPENIPNTSTTTKRMATELESGKKPKETLEVITIKELNPFIGRWMIKGRVLFKSEMRTFNSARGDGKLFSFEVSDGSARVKVVAFSQVADIFYPLIEVHKTYKISQGLIKMANKKYSSNNFDYEIQLEKNSEVIPIDDAELPANHFDFVKISDLTIGNGLVDVAGVIKEVFPYSTVTTKSSGRDILKRNIILMDETGTTRLTIWGAKAEEEFKPGDVIAVNFLKVGEYDGVNLSTTGTTQIISNFSGPEAISLNRWYQETGKDIVIEKPKKAQLAKTIASLKEGEQEYANIRATVLFLKEEALFYDSCPSLTCNKKVTFEEGSGYRCERCNYVYETCGNRYMLSMNVGDYTGQIWITLFDEVAAALFGMPATDLKALSETDPMELQRIVKGVVTQEYNIRLRIRNEVYNGEQRTRYNCMGIQTLNPVQETHNLLEAIEAVY